ncbi:sulfite exporter TauE/SafE family protein [Octadecabacter sp. 1_MG-2023]|uniref:sulfite exporter TauE/SafE family protein n=1 Tax=unclassified Octadecabacter TaxID=196158 RepID=UPI001C093D8A|nr:MULTISPECIES: sulfite exporter TauE/SafE family protein [unclassified Octadecabacter]MBU2993366.1 sulfite exporter TauE/SafE family protein [Octadecabacter sp. B2R22]MDO6733178.1 sulfite exporter TauE/SafE family protein [Octadecabacter sp. 1_MG-2023]
MVLLIAIAAYFIGGILKGAMGFGLPILAIPVMTVTHSLPIALSVAILPTVLTNIAQLWSFRQHRGVPILPKFLILGAFGLCFGAVLLSRINNAYIEIALGVMVLAYLVSRLRRAGAKRRARPDLAPAYGFLAGVVHGSTGLSGLVGPPYMHSLNLPRPEFVFSTGSMFTLFSLMQAPVLFSLGLFHEEALWISIVILPFAFGGLYLGGLIGARMQSDTFSHVVLGVLGVTAILPIFNGLRSLVLG